MDLHARVDDDHDAFARNVLKVWLYGKTDHGRIVDYIRHTVLEDGTVTYGRAQYVPAAGDPTVPSPGPEPLVIPAEYAKALAIELLRYCGEVDPGSAVTLRKDLEHEQQRRDLAEDRLADVITALLPSTDPRTIP